MAPTLLLALLASPADAGVFAAKTSRGDWPTTQVARDFVLPKGYLQVGLHLDSKASRAFRDGDGDLVDYEEGTVWRYSRLTLHVDQGFSRQLTLYARIPHVHAALRNDRDTAVSTLALGDIHTGVIWQPTSGEKHAEDPHQRPPEEDRRGPHRADELQGPRMERARQRPAEGCAGLDRLGSVPGTLADAALPSAPAWRLTPWLLGLRGWRSR